LKDNCFNDAESLSGTQKSDSDEMSLDEIMSLWDRKAEDQGSEASLGTQTEEDENDETQQDENEEVDLPQISIYKGLISKTPAYSWLLARLRMELNLNPAEPNLMDAIGQKIISFLPLSHKVSRKKSSDVYKITYEVNWDPFAFFNEQAYEDEPDEAVGRAVTITGSAVDAQALSCEHYLRQTWPSAGKDTISLVRDVICSGRGYQHTCKFRTLQ
jgi:hypothetical protein